MKRGEWKEEKGNTVAASHLQMQLQLPIFLTRFPVIKCIPESPVFFFILLLIRKRTFWPLTYYVEPQS